VDRRDKQYPHSFKKSPKMGYLTNSGKNIQILDILDIVVLTLELGMKVCNLWNYDLI
jgi:hypothetical protein